MALPVAASGKVDDLNMRAYQRMPIGYGAFPGPRQSAIGQPLPGWQAVKARTMTVVFTCPLGQLNSFLPHSCFRIDSPISSEDLGYASISFTRLTNLPWLAGRGYNHVGLYIHDVVCEGAHEVVRGKYLSVLFENRADPISSGREELGFAKVFASIDETNTASSCALEIGWEGASFGRINLDQAVPWTKPPQLLAESDERSQGLLHFKYIPRTGEPGKCDIQYPTFSPLSSGSEMNIEERLQYSNATFKFDDLGFEKLPTLHHIAAKLARLEVQSVVDARVIDCLGASDFSTQRMIEI